MEAMCDEGQVERERGYKIEVECYGLRKELECRDRRTKVMQTEIAVN